VQFFENIISIDFQACRVNLAYIEMISMVHVRLHAEWFDCRNLGKCLIIIPSNL
jgi:hypothetical protein